MQHVFPYCIIFFCCYAAAMQKTITPQEIRDRAYAARISINKLLGNAGVSNTTLWRWERNLVEEPSLLTMARIIDALEAIEKERAS